MMGRRIVTLLLLALAMGINVRAGDEDFAVSKIPKELLKNANAVVRMSHTEINIVSAGEITMTEQYAITILNEKGKEYGWLVQRYDKFKTVTSVHGWLYDKDGSEADKMKKSGVSDVAANSESSFFDEDRYKFYRFDYNEYPYTVVYEVEKKFATSFYLPDWTPQPAYDWVVMESDIVVTYPKDFALRYRAKHFKNEPVLTHEAEQNKLSLSVSNLPAREKPDNFSAEHRTPELELAADQIVLGEKQGNVATWGDFGKFFYELNENRDALPDATKKIVHQLTDTCKSVFSKISKLHVYLQKNTRYVNITLGIGGQQTHDATYVAEKGYGDCKALSNYMKALLKEAGVTSYQALIYGGYDGVAMDPDFTHNAFNHVILCVPATRDTVWIDCTSKTDPAGYLSGFTNSRYALLLTPSGGVVVRTPDNSAKNMLTRKAVITVDDKDQLQGIIDAAYGGYWWEHEFGKTDDVKSKVDDYMNTKYSIPTYRVQEYKTEAVTRGYVPVLNEHVVLSGSCSVARNGNRILLSPRVFTSGIQSPSSFEARTDSFRISQSYRVIDTIVYNFSEALTLENTPRDVSFDFPFAKFQSKVSFDADHRLVITSYQEMKKGVYASALFADYIRLCKELKNGTSYDKVILTVKK
jgi:Domain of Unknown Function with PDB structure (DUF3857)